MGKINIDKTGSFDPIRTDRQIELRKPARDTKQLPPIKNAAEKDTLSFSSQAAEVGKLVDQLKELPEIRADRVKGLSEQIAAGDYEPSSDSIADAILKDEKI